MTTPAQRSLHRLQRRIFRCYEAILAAALLSLPLWLLWPAEPAAGQPLAHPAQCGNIQSSTVVMDR